MSLQALFDFITDPTINENNMDEYLDMWMQEANQEKDPEEQQIEEAVFKQAYIPQRLTQVSMITYKCTQRIIIILSLILS